MNKHTLTQIRECVSRGDRAAALKALRSAIDSDKIQAREGIELMLAVRQGSQPVMLDAVDSVNWGLPGAYRYVPKTEHAFAEEALFQALEEERKLSEERALLPGLLQHDLANVLCQVSLSLAVFSAVTDESERARCMRDIQGGVKRMSELLSGMRFLFLTRGGAADYGPGDLSAFIRELVNEPGVWPAGAPVTLELPPALSCSYSPTLLRHALVNLIGNAVAYSHGTWVRVRLSPVRGETWQLSVANGGPGIPADHMAYLFELGHAAKYTSKLGSPGLGLYIARTCVRFHGSVLRVKTRDAITAFSFNVRVAKRNQASGQAASGNFYAA